MFKKVLVATDGSDHANKAVDLASDMAAEDGAALTVLSVIESGALTEDAKRLAVQKGVDMSPVPGIPDLATIYPNVRAILPNVGEILANGRIKAELAEAVMEEARDRASVPQGANIRGRTKSRDAAEEILSVAEAEGADLIVMGCRGLGALKSLFVGSVSQKVSNLANCTCITVK